MIDDVIMQWAEPALDVEHHFECLVLIKKNDNQSINH